MHHNILNALRDAGQYFHCHAGSVVVLYIDQICFEQEVSRLHQLCDDIALLCSLNIRLVVVFSPFDISERMMIDDEVTLASKIDEISRTRIFIERLLAHSAYKYRHSTSVVSGSFIVAKPYGIIDGKDHGFYGRIRSVEAHSLVELHKSQPVILVPPIGYSPNGEMFVLSGLSVAEEVACALNAEKLIILSEFSQGFPREMGVSEALTLENALNPLEIKAREKYFLRASISVLKNVGRVHLLDIRIPGCLLLELLTRDGIGVMVTDQQYDLLRQGTLQDIPQLLRLIRPFEEDGTLIKRSVSTLENDIHHFTLMFRDGALIGCVAFYPYVEDAMGELACLVIHPDYRKGRKANVLLEHIELLAHEARLCKIFLLTTQTAHWFIENGFKVTDKEVLPIEKQAQYNKSRNSQVLVKELKR